MANKIKNSDLFEGGLFVTEIDKIKELLRLAKDLKTALSEVGRTTKEGLTKINKESSESIEANAKAVDDLTKSTEAYNKVVKEEIALNDDLKKAKEDETKNTREVVAEKIKNQQATKKLKDEVRDEAILNDKNAGTLQKLAASGRKLRRERESLNLETKKGKDRLVAINKELDKNNTKIAKNSDQLKKAKEDETKNTREVVAEKIKNQQATKKLKDEVRDEAILNDKNAGTLQKLAASGRKLRRERESLNLETKKGKDRLVAINKELDKNNTKIAKNSDQLKKQKLNVGNYNDSMKNAINSSGLFSSQLAILQRVQATLNAVTKKNTAETKANAAAQKAAGKGAGGFSKALKFLKIALISTGIGAIVVGLGALIAAFAGTQRGADAFTKILRPLQTIFQKFVGFLEGSAFKALDGLKAAFDDPKQAVIDLGNSIKEGLVNRFTGFIDVFKSGGSIISNGFKILAGKVKLALKDVPIIGKSIDVEQVTKDIAEATEAIKGDFHDLANASIQATTGITNGLEKIAEVAGDIAEETRIAIEQGQQLDSLIKEFERRQIDVVIPLANARLEYQKLKEIANDQLATDEERLKALKDAEKVQRFISKQEGDLLQLRIDRMELEQSFNDTSREEELELANLKAEQIQFEEKAQKKIAGLKSLASGIELRALNKSNKAIADTIKFIDEIEGRVNEDEFVSRIEKTTKKYEEELKKVNENILISDDKKIELRLILEQQYSKDLLKIEEDRRKKQKEAEEKAADDKIKTSKRALKEIELEGIRAGKTHEEIDKELHDKKIELLKEEIAIRKALGQDVIDLELELAKEEANVLDDSLDNEKENAEKRKEIQKTLFDGYRAQMDEYYDSKLERIDEDLAANEELQDKLLDAQNEGVANAQESIAQARAEQARLEEEQQRIQEQQARRELLLTALQTFAANGGDLGKTLGDITLLAAAVQAVPLFKDGIEDTGRGGNLDADGGFHAIIHRGERILTDPQNQKIKASNGGKIMSNNELTDTIVAVNELGGLTSLAGINNGAAIVAVSSNPIDRDYSNYFESIDKSLKDLPNQMPVQELQFDPIRKMLIEEIKRQNGTTRNIHKTGRLF